MATLVEWKETLGRFELRMNNVPTDYVRWNEEEQIYVDRRRQPVAPSLEDAKDILVSHYTGYEEKARVQKAKIMNRTSPSPRQSRSVQSPTFYDDLSQYFL